MFLTLKRSTLYTLFLICSLAVFVPAYGIIDPNQEGFSENQQDQQETQDQENQDQEDSQEGPQEGEGTTTELDEAFSPLDTLEVLESGSLQEESISPSIDSPEIPSTTSEYYDEEDEEETSESVISFNFLYYLLQKFRFSDSLSY